MNTRTSKGTALIIGGAGQDGAYLASLLLLKGYRVTVSTRDAKARLVNLEQLGVRHQVGIVELDVRDLGSVSDLLSDLRPMEIYNLAGQSSVGISFRHPIETFESNSIGTLNVLDAVRRLRSTARVYIAGSGEVFGDAEGAPATESSAICPLSPYGAAKATAVHVTRVYREAYGLFACTGFLFNHESPLRPPTYVTKKIARAAARIGAGGEGRLTLGDLSIRRDWGYAPEYVEAMWRMLQLPDPVDLIIGTGVSTSLQEMVEHAFRCFGLDWREHVDIDQSLFRPSEIRANVADPSKAYHVIGWRASILAKGVMEKLVSEELKGADAD